MFMLLSRYFVHAAIYMSSTNLLPFSRLCNAVMESCHIFVFVDVFDRK